MDILTSILIKLAETQKRHAKAIFIFAIIITIIVGYGIKNIQMESDISKEMPRHLPIYKLNDRVTDKFGGQDTVLVLFQIESSGSSDLLPTDIRDPYILNYITFLEQTLKKESAIRGVSSVASFTDGMMFYSLEQSKAVLKTKQGTNGFISDDYKTTMMIIKADIGSSERKIRSLVDLINENIDDNPRPPGVKMTITGSPSMRVTIFQLLAHDAIYTLILAAIIVIIILIFMERSFTKAMLVSIPLVLGIIWTVGTLGWLGIKISIATAGLGAMIIGLGVEYGVFMMTRYQEERHSGKDQLESLKIAIPGVGTAVMGSGLTTIAGFLALTLSIMPMIQHLGISLALGISYCLIACLFVEPVVMLLEEDFEEWHAQRYVLPRYKEARKKGHITDEHHDED